jgi:hypothetical protein
MWDGAIAVGCFLVGACSLLAAIRSLQVRRTIGFGPTRAAHVSYRLGAAFMAGYAASLTLLGIGIAVPATAIFGAGAALMVGLVIVDKVYSHTHA